VKGLSWGVLAVQIRTGTPPRTGVGLGESGRTAGGLVAETSHLHQRGRAQAADNSPSSRAAFSRADIASLQSLDYERVATLPFKLEVRPVTGREIGQNKRNRAFARNLPKLLNSGDAAGVCCLNRPDVGASDGEST
jgi:hypothetical protein